MIWHYPMGSIHRTLDSSSGSTKYTDFIQCVDGREPQIHKFWCLGLDGITREFHPTAHVEVSAGAVEKFVTDYLAKNECQINIIRQLSINDSVQFLVFSDQSWGTIIPFICNHRDCVKAPA